MLLGFLALLDLNLDLISVKDEILPSTGEDSEMGSVSWSWTLVDTLTFTFTLCLCFGFLIASTWHYIGIA